MKSKFEVPMMQGTAFVTLATVVAAVPLGDWTWRFLAFSGTGVAPHGMDMLEFENVTRANGYSMDMAEFKLFVDNNKQTWDCLIIALPQGDGRSNQELLKADHADEELVIEGFDSTTWTIWSKDLNRLHAISRTLNEVQGKP